MNKKDILAIVDAPEIRLDEFELAGDALLKFYRALGWNGEDILDPCKVHTSKEVYYRLYDAMLEKCSDGLSVGATMINVAPSVNADIPASKVYLLKGWTTPAE